MYKQKRAARAPALFFMEEKEVELKKRLREVTEIDLVLDNRQEYSELVDYQLYEANIATGLKFIFHRMLEKDVQVDHGDNNERKLSWIEQKDNSNILSFIGGRGAGKTTSMKEFCRILEKMNGKADDERNTWLKKVLTKDETIARLKRSTFRFHVLNIVDAALLNESEDLLELILVSLYQEYSEKLEKNATYFKGYQSTMLEIEQIFEDLLAMYSSTRKKSGYDEDYTLATLARMTGNSAFIREKISKLLALMSSVQKQAADYEYYVIPIDDLDLNLEHGYEMIEQVQKYFSDERILILVTMDYEQMCDVCMEHFHRGMKFTDDFAGGNSMYRSQVLATDMMTKVFPLDQRIYLPDAKKQGKQMGVVIQKKPLEMLPVKKYIMEKVAECMKIYYDAKGSKRHFIEPDTVRQLVFYNNFLDSLYFIDFENMRTWKEIEALQNDEDKELCMEMNRKQMIEYSYNHHRFNDDIAKRQAQVMLTIPHRQAFKTFLEFDLSRRAMYLEKAENKEDQILFKDVTMEERNRYSYADLIRKIYIWGRLNYEDKPFISCVMASFTSEMVREYLNYRYNPDAEGRAVSEERLCRFMGRSFGNEWLGNCLYADMQPESKSGWHYRSINIPENMEADMTAIQDTGRIGFRSNVDIEHVGISFNLNILSEAGKIPIEANNDAEYKRRKKQTRQKYIREWLTSENVIKILECIDLLLTRFDESESGRKDYSGPDISFESEFPSDSWMNQDKNTPLMTVTYRENFILDIFGFIPKSFDYEGYREKMEEKLIQELASFLCEYLSYSTLAENEDVIRNELKSIVKEQSIFSGTDKSPIKNEVAFPFYDFDLSYNVIKRFRGRMVGYESDDLYEYLLHIYQLMGNLLKEEAEAYDYVRCKYSDIYEESVYLKAFRELSKNEKAREKISLFLRDLSGWKTALYKPSSPDD